MSTSSSLASRAGRAGLVVAALGVWVALVLGLVYLAGNLALRTWAAFDGFLPGYRLALVLSSKTLLLPAVLLAFMAYLLWIPRLSVRLGVPRRRVTLALVGSAVLALVWNALPLLGGEEAWVGKNRFGFARIWPASETRTFDPQNGEAALLTVRTNSESCRDDEWPLPAPADGTIRALLVGDSIVFGLSLPENADLLDRGLEERLNAAGAGRWDVWNIAAAPASMGYFVESITRVAREARPQYAIVFFDCDSDFAFHDEQLALADKPDWFYRLGRALDLLPDLLWTSKNPWPLDEEDHASPEVVRARLDQFERLLEDAKTNGYHVVVWQVDVPCPRLAPYHGRPEVSFFDWQAEVGLSCGEDPARCPFYLDPALGHPSKHLTPLGMRHVAGALAPRLLELEARRRGGPAAAAGAPVPAATP